MRTEDPLHLTCSAILSLGSHSTGKAGVPAGGGGMRCCVCENETRVTFAFQPQMPSNLDIYSNIK